MNEGYIAADSIKPRPPSTGLFATPLWQFEVDQEVKAVFPEIIAAIDHDRQTTVNPAPYSTIGNTAFHTASDYTDRPQAWSQLLKRYFVDLGYQCLAGLGPAYNNMLPPLEVWSWCVVLGKGDRSKLHSHAHSDFSGVIWLAVPDDIDPREGVFRFHDCRGAATASGLFGNKGAMVQPIAGQGIIFPSWMEHEVLAHNSLQPRISLAFDIKLTVSYRDDWAKP